MISEFINKIFPLAYLLYFRYNFLWPKSFAQAVAASTKQ